MAPAPLILPSLPVPALAGTPVSLAGRLDIYPGSPWPMLDGPAGPAFAASLPNAAATAPTLFAIIATAGLPPRGEALAPLRAFNHPNLLRLVDSGTLDWPGHGLAAVYVFAVPPGPTLRQLYETQQRGLDDEQLGQRLLPLINMLRSFGSTGLSHGALSPDNIYVGPGGLVAGECVSCPPSYRSGGYLTIERSQAEPSARGLPTTADDLYALGTLATIISLGRDPTAELSPERLLSHKLDYGSYNALQGTGEISAAALAMGERLRGSTAELARGLLDDTVGRRWTMPELEVWLAGRHPTPRPLESTQAASRPFILTGATHDPGGHGALEQGTWTRRTTAQLLAHNQPAAARAIASGDLQRWINRTLEDAALATALTSDLAQARRSDGSEASASPQQVARATLLLDPTGPVRYRGSSVMPSGYGAWLAERFLKAGDLQVPAELLASGLMARWLQEQAGGRADYLSLQQQLERARGQLERKQIGYGLERVLYELAPAQYCLSPLVRTAHPLTVNAALAALEKTAAAGAGGAEPIDRHLATFLIARDRRLTEGLLVALLPTGDAARRAIGILTLLAEAQYRHGPANLPALGSWLARQLEPAIRRYHRPSTQNQLRRKLEAAAATGDLNALVQLVDNPATLEADINAFGMAKGSWLRAAREIAELQADVERRAEIERRVGQPIASAIAILLGLVAMAGAVVLSLRGSL